MEDYTRLEKQPRCGIEVELIIFKFSSGNSVPLFFKVFQENKAAKSLGGFGSS